MALLGELSYALISSPLRHIGGIIADVVVEEIHRDSLIPTVHPVESGAAITDHAFLAPAQVEIRCGHSNSSHADAGHARSVYDALRRLQASRRPFSVSTGKRNYRNMLLADLSVTTDPKTENVLAVSARLQQIIIVSTKTTSAGSSTASPGADQSAPETTGTVQNKGEIQPIPVSDQDFASAVRPGSSLAGFDTNGGTLGNGSFNLSPDQFGLGGLSSSGIPEITLPEQEVFAPSGGGSSGGSNNPAYNIWEFG